jgi:hypothetical protein
MDKQNEKKITYPVFYFEHFEEKKKAQKEEFSICLTQFSLIIKASDKIY